MADIITPQWGTVITPEGIASQELLNWMADVTDALNNPDTPARTPAQLSKVIVDVGLSLNSLLPTTLTFTDSIVDSIFDTSSGSSITVNQSGRFRVNFMCTVTGTTANYRYTAKTDITVNGTPQATASNGYIRVAGGSNHTSIFCDTVLDLTSGDVIGIDVARISTTSGDATTEAGWIEITEI